MYRCVFAITVLLAVVTATPAKRSIPGAVESWIVNPDRESELMEPAEYNTETVLPGKTLREGDIYEDPADSAANRNGKMSVRWPKAELFYELDSSLPQSYHRTIMNAIADIERCSCVRIRPRSRQDNYVSIVHKNGCWAELGIKNRGKQEMSIGNTCNNKGTVIHEFFHALGIEHTHVRQDRDKYVDINLHNVMSGNQHNFEMVGNDFTTFGLPYDYASVMHYKRTAFSKNGRLTLEPKDPSVKLLGQREGMSTLDIKFLNMFYECGDSYIRKPECQGEPPMDCTNQHEKCDEWAAAGECTRNAGYMLYNCANSCNLDYCKNGQNGGSNSNNNNNNSDNNNSGACKDNNSNCKVWADSQQCSKNPGYMHENCRKACGLCHSSNNNNNSGNTADCEDKNSNCAAWARGGQCTIAPGYMRPNCPKSCNLCSGGGGGASSNCVNKNQHCDAWAKNNQCAVNPGYMNKNCAKACNRC